ncbi:hypothetical protein SCP_0905370 [Sparassis crispa]|uniref:C2H2-type domain-containing protein n=1 Tax=Sparassis crispa TaxID=139825 RepID=A0A401GWQ4_9APHY|nr:hypothetical protein SCP_0905370 [Sparassis crispa]GBE86657.1 hypothetical protein SCP_0905370 [Sparassis crispa]
MLQSRLANAPPLPRQPFDFGRSRPNILDDISLLVSSVVAQDKHHVRGQSPAPGQSPEPPSPPSSDSPDYHYVPSPSPDTMYSDRYPDASAAQLPNLSYSLQHPQSHSRRSPAAALAENVDPSSADMSEPEPAPYSASPLSSPEMQHHRPNNFSFPAPMSAPHSQQLFSFSTSASVSAAGPPSSLEYSTLDRRMSEPVLGGARQSFPAVSTNSGGPSPFTYDPSSSAGTTILPSPVSPRPSSASFSSYSSYGHPRQSSGDFSASAPSGWSLKHSASTGDLGQDATAPPVSPVYAGSVSGSDVSGTGVPSPPRGSPRKIPQGNAVKKRPRRRYDEIERLYQCSWPNCTKAYGTLNHLNAHVTMQKHGPKRSPGEFKELRKQWRQQKKEADDQEREREAHAHALRAMRDPFTHTHLHAQELDHHTLTSRHARRRLSLDPYPDPHNLQYLSGFQSPTSPYAFPGVAVQSAGYPPLRSPVDEVQFVHPSAHHPHAHHIQSDDELQGIAQYYSSQQQRTHHAHGDMSWPGPLAHHQQSELRHAQGMPMVSLTGATRPLHPYYSPAHQHQQQQQQQQMSLSALAATPSASFSSLGSAHGHNGSNGHNGGGGASGGNGYALGSNRLPPDSTLLTPLPGYDPESELMMDQRYAAGSNAGAVQGQSAEGMYRREYD